MSIGYNNLYNITAGIFACFSNKHSTKRMLTVNHTQKKRDDTEILFPITKFNTSSRENFVLYNLYINFTEAPSSLMSAISKLSELDLTKAISFKNEIVHYRKFLKEDIEKIEMEALSIDIKYIIKNYRANRIKWYTFYFYLESLPNAEEEKEKIRKSRINSRLIEKIETLLLYVSFSEDSKKSIKILMQDRIVID